MVCTSTYCLQYLKKLWYFRLDVLEKTVLNICRQVFLYCQFLIVPRRDSIYNRKIPKISGWHFQKLHALLTFYTHSVGLIATRQILNFYSCTYNLPNTNSLPGKVSVRVRPVCTVQLRLRSSWRIPDVHRPLSRHQKNATATM